MSVGLLMRPLLNGITLTRRGGALAEPGGTRPVEMVNFPRIRPYKTFALSNAGERTPVAAHEIVLERPVGVDLEINLAPHPNRRGEVSFSTFRGSSLLLEPASSSDAYVFIEDWPVGDRRRKVTSHRYSRPTLGHVYLVDARGQKHPTPERTFAVQIADQAELHIELCPSRPWMRHIKIECSRGRLAIRLGASNVVSFTIDE